MLIPRFTDLRAMVSELEADPEYATLGKAIRSALLAQSCLADIKQAADCCAALRSLMVNPAKIGTIERMSVEASLLANAITLYARATATAAKQHERGSIQITSSLTPDQRADHELLVTIRNRVIAHVYVAEPIDSEFWHQAEMFAVESKDRGWKPAVASRRVQNDTATLNRLERQLPIARSILVEKSRHRLEAVTDMLNQKRLPLAAFERHSFDPVRRFGSIQAVQMILDGQAGGEASVPAP